MAFPVATIPIVIIGIRTTEIRTHNIMATIFVGWQIVVGFGFLEIMAG